ncbi:MAG: amidohydrolase family protein, partial [Phycisphaerae bacterium]|nr:amidohydrolase family protein [Phycisphaerae bacterium]
PFVDRPTAMTLSKTTISPPKCESGAKKIPCVLGPILHSRSKFELKDSTPRNPAIMSKAGAIFAIQTDEMSAVQYMRINAALAVQYGLPEIEALKAITIYPARIIGVDTRVGSLEVGKDADIIVLDGPPLDYRTNTELVIIDGIEQYRA